VLSRPVGTVVVDEFEWDEGKAERNRKKHGISFEEAVTAVRDPNAVVLLDESAPGEDRFQVIGRSWRGTILFTVLVERGERDRIISARWATAKEERRYLSEP
jgi:uncharacterized DUF497 family protein